MSKPPRAMTPEERALWTRVAATVKPITRNGPPPPLLPDPALPVAPPAQRIKGRVPPPAPPIPAAPTPLRRAETLDGGWDRRLSRGLIAPDRSIDLHGHTLARAHARVDEGLDRAIANGERLILLITGKPPRAESDRPHARGAIRAAVGDWLAASRHAPRIAAVRNAHPRHGGQGALYIVLRRPRPQISQKS